ncbi:hypothetical protein ACU686_39675 [Yinghuangia aomiensis]
MDAPRRAAPSTLRRWWSRRTRTPRRLDGHRVHPGPVAGRSRARARGRSPASALRVFLGAGLAEALFEAIHACDPIHRDR